jgi:DNA replication protein DnaC
MSSTLAADLTQTPGSAADPPARPSILARVSFQPESTATPRCQFDLCDGSGFLFDEETAVARDCRCRRARIAAAHVRSLEARIPRRYRAISFEHSDVFEMERRFPSQVRALRAFVRDIDANLDAGRGLWLTGGFGTGKTALAMIVSRAAIDSGRSVAIYSCPRLLNMIRESIDGGGVVDFLDRIAAADLLHIDDLGAEHRTDWVLEQLYSIVNARYEEERSTIVTSNLNPIELGEQLGERIVSRLEGSCDLVGFYGADARRDGFTLAG